MLILDLVESSHSGTGKAHIYTHTHTHHAQIHCLHSRTHAHHVRPHDALPPAQESTAKRTYADLLQPTSYAPQSLELLGQGAFKRLKVPQPGPCAPLFNCPMQQ